jgi:hypothetical protein
MSRLEHLFKDSMKNQDWQLFIDRIRELQAAKALDDLTEEFGDVPWRVPLAALLRDVPNREQRVRCLWKFFVIYEEESRK